METYIIYGIVLLILVIIVFSWIFIAGKLKRLNNKLEEANKKVSEYLKEKYELIIRLKENLEKNNIEILPKSLLDLNGEDFEPHEFDEELKKHDLIISQTFEFNVTVEFSDEDKFLYEKFKDNNIKLTGVKRYFNKNASVLNKMVQKFPSKYIAKLSKVNIKEEYPIIKEEILELL